MKLLMIGHLLGDFYFQTDKMAKKKKKSFAYTALHCFIYSLVMFVVLAIATGNMVAYVLPVLLVGTVHLLVDGIKYSIYKRVNTEKSELTVFIVDQIIHIAILFVVDCLYTIIFDISWIPGLSESFLNAVQKAPIFIFAFLLCGKPAAIIVSLVFGMIPKTIEKADSNDGMIIGRNKQESARIGSWIGILEREIILVLGVLGQYAAMGFVITAKSLARHNQLNEPAFAEKYLIGTLLSLFIALLSIVMCRIL